MEHFMTRYEAQTYAMLRIIAGFLFLWHGAQKVLGFPIEMSTGAPTFIVYIAGPIELFGGVFILIGLFTRWAAFLCSGLMAFAYWLVHGTNAFLPFLNGGELAVLYSFVFLFISTHGAGIWSIDAIRNKSAVN